MLASLFHPSELVALVKWKLTKDPDALPPTAVTVDMQWCYRMLNKTSRSFAFVIRELGDDLRDAVCLFYLILRGLDSVEDDMAFPLEDKQALLVQFHEKLYVRGWKIHNVGEKPDEIVLLQNFDRVIGCFLDLAPKFQQVICDITQRMGAGMTEFLTREVDTLDDWDRYCHYVAGLVGIGLSQLFAASGCEAAEYAQMDDLSNSMGLFLQKTNIIRDYFEDLQEKRIFWPKATWTKYTSRLGNFAEPTWAKPAVSCLNDLITNALEHIPDCLEYLSGLHDPQVFNFCAIPQVMAIGTLANCYDNHDVFTDNVVKLRRGESAQIAMSMDGLDTVYAYFDQYISLLESKIDPADPNAETTKAIVARIRSRIDPHLANRGTGWTKMDVAAAAALVASGAYLINKRVAARL